MNLRNLIPTLLLWMIFLYSNASYGQETKTITFTPSEVKGTVANSSLVADGMFADPISISSTNAQFGNGKNYRFYTASTITISSSEGNISKIVFTKSPDAASSHEFGNWKDISSETKLTISNKSTATWKGTAKEVSIYAAGVTWVSKVEVTYTSQPSVTLSGNDDTATLLAANNGKTVNATINRTLVADGGWYTLCLPFDVSDVSPFKDAEIRKFKSMEGTTMNFEDATELKAGHAYLVKPTETIANPVFKNVVIKNTESSDGDNGYLFVGTFVKKDLKTDGTELFLGDNNQFFLPTADNNTMNGLRGYFVVPEGTNTSKMDVAFDRETTSIKEIAPIKEDNDKVYNLNGQEVGKSHGLLKGGIYIKNGKKFIIK